MIVTIKEWLISNVRFLADLVKVSPNPVTFVIKEIEVARLKQNITILVVSLKF